MNRFFVAGEENKIVEGKMKKLSLIKKQKLSKSNLAPIKKKYIYIYIYTLFQFTCTLVHNIWMADHFFLKCVRMRDSPSSKIEWGIVSWASANVYFFLSF